MSKILHSLKVKVSISSKILLFHLCNPDKNLPKSSISGCPEALLRSSIVDSLRSEDADRVRTDPGGDELEVLSSQS